MEAPKSSAVQPTPDKPEVEKNDQGDLRVVGVEIELGGIELDAIVERLQEELGGTIEPNGPYEAKLRDSRLGNIQVELDALLFRDLKVKGFLNRFSLEKVKADLPETIEAAMATEARRFVPFEIVFEPVPIGKLQEIDKVAARFRKVAEGTSASVFNAYGLHLNPELPQVDASTVLRYLQAFLCLYEELKKEHAIDTSRSISPFIAPFPRTYALKVLGSDYQPDANQLIEDYLEANATRNRPLDLLPVLAWMDEEKIAEALPDEKVSKRPAFHYRLPNCRIDEEDWSVSKEWNIWIKVEALASDEESLRKACDERHWQLLGFWSRLIARIRKMFFLP